MSRDQKFDTENEFIGLVHSNLVMNEETSKKLKRTAKKHCFLAVFLRLFNSNQIKAHQTNIFIFSIIFLISRHPKDF